MGIVSKAVKSVTGEFNDTMASSAIEGALKPQDGRIHPLVIGVSGGFNFGFGGYSVERGMTKHLDYALAYLQNEGREIIDVRPSYSDAKGQTFLVLYR